MLERARRLRTAGAKVGASTGIGRIRLYGRADQLEVGERCHIQHGVSILTDGWAALGGPNRWRGTRVSILANCGIFRGCWIMPGVTIGPNALVVPGAVVARDIPAGCVAMGEPARPIMSLDMWAERAEAMRRARPDEFRSNESGFVMHGHVLAMVAGWIETIHAQRERRQASTAGLPSPDELRLLLGRIGPEASAASRSREIGT